MSYRGQIIVILLSFLLSLFYLRSFIYGIIRYRLNNSAYKKRKKGETIKERLFYSRYKKEIPLFWRIFHYFVWIVHLTAVIICTIIYLAKLSPNIGKIISSFIFCFDGVWILIIGLFFWSPKPDYAFERWITKRSPKDK